MADDPPPADLDRVEQALMSLRPREREVLLLSAREKLRTDEIALHLGISSESAERHLAKALRKLDRRVERGGRPWRRFW